MSMVLAGEWEPGSGYFICFPRHVWSQVNYQRMGRSFGLSLLWEDAFMPQLKGFSYLKKKVSLIFWHCFWETPSSDASLFAWRGGGVQKLQPSGATQSISKKSQTDESLIVESIVICISEREEEEKQLWNMLCWNAKHEALYAMTKHIYSTNFALQFPGSSHVLKGWFLLPGLARRK